jgi:hypothetical protein
MKSIHERVMILHHHHNYDLKTSWAIVKESADGQYGGKPCPAGGPYKKAGCEIPEERNCKNSTKGLCSRKPTAPPGQDGRYEHYKKSCTDELTPWDKNPCKSMSQYDSHSIEKARLQTNRYTTCADNRALFTAECIVPGGEQCEKTPGGHQNAIVKMQNYAKECRELKNALLNLPSAPKILSRQRPLSSTPPALSALFPSISSIVKRPKKTTPEKPSHKKTSPKKKSIRSKSVRSKSVRSKSVRSKSVRKKSVRSKSVRKKSVRKKSGK